MNYCIIRAGSTLELLQMWDREKNKKEKNIYAKMTFDGSF